MNHYTTLYSQDKIPEVPLSPGFWNDQDSETWQDDDWPKAESSWLRSVPWGIRGVLNWIKEQYGDIDVYVTENGFSTADIFDLSDDDRVKFYRGYINEVLKGKIRMFVLYTKLKQ